MGANCAARDSTNPYPAFISGPACEIHECTLADGLHMNVHMGYDDATCADIMLVQAVTRGDVTDVQRALAFGADVNTKQNLKMASSSGRNDISAGKHTSRSPLIIACSSCYADVAEVLLQVGADPCIEDNAGWTPLFHVLAHGELELAESLLKKTSAVNIAWQISYVHSFKEEFIELCNMNVGAAAASALRSALSPDGFLTPSPPIAAVDATEAVADGAAAPLKHVASPIVPMEVAPGNRYGALSDLTCGSNAGASSPSESPNGANDGSNSIRQEFSDELEGIVLA